MPDWSRYAPELGGYLRRMTRAVRPPQDDPAAVDRLIRNVPGIISGYSPDRAVMTRSALRTLRDDATTRSMDMPASGSGFVLHPLDGSGRLDTNMTAGAAAYMPASEIEDVQTRGIQDQVRRWLWLDSLGSLASGGGRNLLHAIRDAHPDQGIGLVSLDIPETHDFYRRIGFRNPGRGHPMGGIAEYVLPPGEPLNYAEGGWVDHYPNVQPDGNFLTNGSVAPSTGSPLTGGALGQVYQSPITGDINGGASPVSNAPVGPGAPSTAQNLSDLPGAANLAAGRGVGGPGVGSIAGTLAGMALGVPGLGVIGSWGDRVMGISRDAQNGVFSGYFGSGIASQRDYGAAAQQAAALGLGLDTKPAAGWGFDPNSPGWSNSAIGDYYGNVLGDIYGTTAPGYGGGIDNSGASVETSGGQQPGEGGKGDVSGGGEKGEGGGGWFSMGGRVYADGGPVDGPEDMSDTEMLAAARAGNPYARVTYALRHNDYHVPRMAMGGALFPSIVEPRGVLDRMTHGDDD